ncbi:rhamnan synthesis F family protein [Segnochrobactrum spirostomi]|uniref:Rhamnan synthesis protein F n=1 Tax=Segnochrobactrum spirostomi TaxID=2608987 RepID=A0A6A7Y7K5_9HYPH|nr:rhamnan synthesis F family protein [Segnochrobactrum spirostomi]MQT14307.1 hypothetical protein [Segnochrobactrum spirostomi]
MRVCRNASGEGDGHGRRTFRADAAAGRRQRPARARLDAEGRTAPTPRRPAARAGARARRAVRLCRPPPPAERRIGVVCHVFYPDVLPEILALTDAIPLRHRLFLSTDTTEKQAEIEHILAAHPGRTPVDLRLVPNRGRDIAPKYVAFADIYPHLDRVLFLHTKKSLHSRGGDEWRRALMSALVGSPATAASALAIFEAAPDVGIVYPARTGLGARAPRWDGNFAIARDAFARIGLALDPKTPLDFPSGSMFWARPAALQPILDLHLRLEDFQPEAGQIDGTLAHALERSVLVAAACAGFRGIKTIPAETASASNHQKIASVEALRRAVAFPDPVPDVGSPR